jgi:hypothetical protein
MFNLTQAFQPCTARDATAGFGWILRGAIIPIQCQLPEKSAVFLQHRDALRARALIDFINQEFAGKWAIGRCELCLFE